MIATLAVLLFCGLAFAQQTPATQLLPQKQYSDYLKHSASIVATVAKDAAGTFDQLTGLAIALEKTSGWDGTLGKTTTASLTTTPEAPQYLASIRLLFRNDATGLATLYHGKEPEAMALARASALLREHGFAFAANALGVMAPDLPGKRIYYLLCLPKEQRGVVEQVLREDTTPPNRTMLAQTALDMFMHPPAGVIFDGNDCFALALRLGQGTSLISLETAQQLFQAGKGKEAAQMATQLAQDRPADVRLQNLAARFLVSIGQYAAGTAVYQHALTTVPEPMRRDVRLGYLEFLRWQQKNDEITRLQAGQDALLAGDALLVAKKYPEATKRYINVLSNPTMLLDTRLAAWVGLLDADPAEALSRGPALLDALRPLPVEARQIVIPWLGRQLWITLNREIPPARGAFVTDSRTSCRPLHEVAHWETHVATLMTTLLEIDPVACLRPDGQYTPQSLRYPAAVAYALAGKPNEAVDIATRKLDYQIPPPPGGWKIFDGTQAPDATKPRAFTTPTAVELQQLTPQLLGDLSRCANANTVVPPVSAVLAQRLAAQIVITTKDTEMKSQLKSLAYLIKITVDAMDPMPYPLKTNQPPPPVRPVDMAQFAPLDAAIRQALTNDLAAKHGLIVLYEGERSALLTASNPELLTALTQLSIFTLDHYAAAWKEPARATIQGNILADHLAVRPVYDMKPYVQILREKYTAK